MSVKCSVTLMVPKNRQEGWRKNTHTPPRLCLERNNALLSLSESLNNCLYKACWTLLVNVCVHMLLRVSLVYLTGCRCEACFQTFGFHPPEETVQSTCVYVLCVNVCEYSKQRDLRWKYKWALSFALTTRWLTLNTFNTWTILSQIAHIWTKYNAYISLDSEISADKKKFNLYRQRMCFSEFS